MMKSVFLVCVLWIACLSASGNPVARIVIKVVDEAGRPIEGATATLVLENDGNYTNKSGVTDTNGLFAAEGKTIPKITIIANKEGYYESGKSFYPSGRSKDKTRYEPWGGVEVLTLRRIIDPKEGKRCGVGGVIPRMNEPLGMDLVIGDWVAPYGKGVVPDFVFICSNDTTNKVASYVLTFPNPGDGIIEFPRNKNGQSLFRWPHLAPADGYATVFRRKQTYSGRTPVLWEGYEELPQEPLDVQCIFRIRTRRDAQGNIVSAYYGKIFSSIGTGWDARIGFGYWLNTDPHSRSLESTDPYSP